MKKIEVKKFYNELNEINDLSGDYVVVTMPSELWTKVLIALYMRGLTNKTLRRLHEVLEEATENGKSKWYK